MHRRRRSLEITDATPSYRKGIMTPAVCHPFECAHLDYIGIIRPRERDIESLVYGGNVLIIYSR